MTVFVKEGCYLGIMKRLILFSWWITLAFASAQEPASENLEALLREALFQEEAARDLDQAAASYEALLEQYEKQRRFAATALFRLAEVHRKRSQPDEAIALYRRLLREFPEHDPLARLSRENLLALGARAIDTPAVPVLDPEAQEIARLKKLLEQSPDRLTAVDAEGWTPLHLAAREGHLRVVTFLLEQGVDVNLAPNRGSPLAVAAEHGRKAMCALLLDKGADIEKYCPLGKAIEANHEHVGELLIARGADVNAQWPEPSATSLLGLATYKKRQSWIERLIASGADVNTIPNSGSPPLFVALRHAREFVPLLLKHGADPNVSHQGQIALHQADTAEETKLLLDAGADASVVNEDGRTALSYARDWDQAKLLLDHGADPAKGVDSLKGELRVRIYRHALYPKWHEESSITVAVPQALHHAVLAKANDGESSSSLADMLAKWRETPTVAKGGRVNWRQLTLLRKGNDPQVVPLTIDSNWDIGLKYGDVLEFTSDNWEKDPNTYRFNAPNMAGLAQKKRVIPITIHARGETYERELVGDRFSSDPMGKRLPRMELGPFLDYLGVSKGARIRLERRDASTFVGLVGQGALSIPFMPHDVLHIDETTSEAKAQRIQAIQARSGNLLYGRAYDGGHYEITLFEFLAWLYAPVLTLQEYRNDNVQPAQYRRHRRQCLPNVDWANVRILRLNEEGEEEVIPVDLVSAMEAFSKEASIKKARGFDLPLQVGDVVDLPVDKTRDLQSWTGWEPGLRHLIQTALMVEVTYRDLAGLSQKMSLEFVPTDFDFAEFGWKSKPSRPLEPGQLRMPRADVFLRSLGVDLKAHAIHVERNGGPVPSVDLTWLRDGDEIRVGSRVFVPTLSIE